MAAVLEKVLLEEISSAEVVKWLTNNSKEEQLTAALAEYTNLKGEFVPYFINFLRDQSLHLLNGSRSSNNTPAKTPLSAKFKRQLSRQNETDDNSSKAPSKRNNKHQHQSGNRVQLFASCESHKRSNYSNRSTPNFENSSYNDQSSYSLSHTHDNSYGAKRSSGRYVSPQPGTDFVPRSQRSIHFHTPDSQNQRSKNRHSFGDFITPEVDKRKTPTQQHGRRSGGRKSSDKKLFPGRSKVTTTPPDFSLANADDFPSLGGATSTSTPKPSVSSVMKPAASSTPMSVAIEKDRSPGIPDGAKLITSSRRITPTLIRPGKSAKPESPLAGSLANFQSPSAGSGWNKAAPSPFRSQALTFQTPKQSKGDSIEDERQFLRAIKSGQVSLESPMADKSSFGDHFTPPTHDAFEQIMTRRKTDNSTEHQAQSVQPPVILENVIYEGAQSETNHVTPVKSKSTTVTDDVNKLVSEKTPSKSTLDCTSLVTPTKALLERQTSNTECVKADPSEVTRKEELCILANLYSAFIDENLVPNLTVELYFIMQLLASRGGSEIEVPNDPSLDIDEIQFFHSVHNAVYFAVTVLSKQKQVLRLLDKGTLRLLVDNTRIADFHPHFNTELTLLHEQCPAKVNPMATSSPIGGVSFQAETDNRYNFPDDTSFHVFRKQRDQFYELIRIWQEHHMSPGWSLVEAEGRRIFDLVTQRTKLANHIHFARLFQSQLIQMCKGDNSVKVEGDDQNITLLVQLKRSNPDKFKRLQERFITPSSVGGPCPPPAFPGCQEFFRDFLVAASCAQFYQHLGDLMTAKIAALNSTEFSHHDNLEEGSDVEERENLANCLFTLRLLGRFLGFVHFLPYQSPDPLPSQIINDYIANRNQTSPAVDLFQFVRVAQNEGRTVMTIPWVVEYLCMIDPLAPQLDCIQKLLQLLLRIHRFTRKHFAGTHSHSQMLVILYLGWMFELQMFPEGLFFKEIADDSDIKEPPEGSLDTLNLVDQHILYTCCPYLGEVRSVLVDFAVGMSSKNVNNVRKITPVSTQPHNNTPLTTKQLQTQLEENFFHNHPASLKRTVDFVADRVASNHIKKFRAETLPQSLKEAYAKAKECANLVLDTSPDKTKRSSGSVIHSNSCELCRALRQSDQQRAQTYCSHKVRDILGAMLPEETSAHVHETCAQISLRIALEKINTWMNTHITPAMFKREMTAEFDKTCKALVLKAAKQTAEKRADQSLEDSISSPTKAFMSSPSWDKNKNVSSPKTFAEKPVLDDSISDVVNIKPLEKDSQESNEKEKETKQTTGKEGSSGPVVNGYELLLESQNALDETLERLPSEVLIDFKDAAANVILHGRMEERRAVIIKCVDEFGRICRFHREMVIGTYSKIITRLSSDLACYLVIHHSKEWTASLKELFLKLWLEHLKEDVQFNNVICLRHFHMLLKQDKTATASFIDFVTCLLCNDLISVDTMSANCITLLQSGLSHQHFTSLCRILCSIVATYHTDICDQSSEHFFDLIDAMFQLADINNYDVIKTEVTAVMETIRKKGSILDQLKSDECLKKARTNADLVADKIELVAISSDLELINGA